MEELLKDPQFQELLKDPQFQAILPYLPYIIGLSILQIVLWLLLANSIRTTLLLVQKENRFMTPGQAFLMALPLFNIYWNFQVVRHLRDSLNNEFFDRKVPIDENPTQREGSMFAWSYLVRNFPLPNVIIYIAMFSNFVAFFMYWRKIAEYKKLLKETAALAEGEVVADEAEIEEN